MRILDDLRLALRQLAKAPGFMALTLAILSLGLGAAIYGFGILYAAVLKPLPFPAAHELMHLEVSIPSQDVDSREVTWDDFKDWREQQTSFVDLAAFYNGTVNVTGSERPERYDGGFMSANAFDLLGVRPILGRNFVEGEGVFGAPDVVILGYDLWQRAYNGDPDIVGKVLRVNGRDSEVVGVMPEGFLFPFNDQLWVPLRFDESQMTGRGGGITLEVYGRLKPGVTRAQASAEFEGISARLAETYPDTNSGIVPVVKPYAFEYIDKGTRAIIWTMMLAVVFVLLIACANVANLLMARTAGRTQEIAVRAAIGAGRRRLVVQMLSESIVLNLIGALVGLALAYWAMKSTDAFMAASNNPPPYWVQFVLDSRSAVFAVLAALAASLLAGIVPALRASGVNINGVLRENARGSTSRRLKWVSQALVVGEIALSFTLLIAAALTTRSVMNVSDVDVGADIDGVMTARIGLPQGTYDETTDQVAFFTQLRDRLAQANGIEDVVITTSLPGTWSDWRGYLADGQEEAPDTPPPPAPYVYMTPGFFDVFNIELLSGRDFDERDTADSEPVVIVNQEFASKAFPGEDAVGRRVRMGDSRIPDAQPVWRTIVGVTSNVRHRHVMDTTRDPVFYVPVQQEPARFMSIAMRGQSNPSGLVATLRDNVRVLDADMPMYWVQTLDETYRQQSAPTRLIGVVFAMLAIIALVLAAGGLYGVISFSVNQRTAELGIRRALGARDGNIFRLVSRQAFIQLGLGLGLGLFGGAGVAQGLKALLVDVSPNDPTSYLTVGALLIAAVAVASYLPTRRAVGIEPMAALRYE